MSTLRLLARLPKSPIGATRPALFHTSGVARDGHILEIEEDKFTAMVENADKPVIVDFYANWCFPCRALSHTLDKVIYENKKVTLIKINMDEAVNLSIKYNITTLPTVYAFFNGEVVDRFFGVRNEEFVKKFVEKHAELAK